MNLGPLHLTIDVTASRQRHTVILAGEADLQGAPDLEAALADVYANAKKTIVIDLRNLTFIDSSGLHVLMGAFETCKRYGLELEIIPGPPNVQRLFQLTGINDVLPLSQAVDQGLDGEQPDRGEATPRT